MAAHAINSHGLEHADERRHDVSPLLELLKNVGSKLLASWAWYKHYRQTEDELASLSDRELNDIGIARYDIPWIALQSANDQSDRR